MNRLHELRQEADEAAEKTWFIQSLEETERTDITLSLDICQSHIDKQRGDGYDETVQNYY